jgi:hypothetical protein
LRQGQICLENPHLVQSQLNQKNNNLPVINPNLPGINKNPLGINNNLLGTNPNQPNQNEAPHALYSSAHLNSIYTTRTDNF